MQDRYAELVAAARDATDMDYFGESSGENQDGTTGQENGYQVW